MNPQAKIVQGFQPIMPMFQGLVSEEQLLQLIAYVQVARATWPPRQRAGRETDGAARPTWQGLIMETLELPERRLRPEVVAPHQGPQAHRDALPGLDHDLLRPRRPLRRC